MKTIFIFLILIINNVAAQKLINNANFLAFLKSNHPNLVEEGKFLSPKAARVKTLEIKISLKDTLDLIGFDSLTTLTINFNNLKSLINLPKSLQTLNCSENKIKNLNLQHLNKLTTLNCSHNELETLILPLSLSKINCSYNQLKKLTVGDNKNALQQLYCNNNQLEELNLLVDRIEDFNCSHNQLQMINVAQPSIISMENVNVGYNPLKKMLPLKYNEYLSCEGVDLTQTADFWEQLSPRLLHLNCSNCNLDTLPYLLPRNLLEFDCGNNRLKSLPKHLPAHLNLLDCSHNLITQLPDFLPYYLQFLYCEHNQLTQLPELLPNGTIEIYCEHNKICKLPELLPLNLRVLNCNNNLITEIMHLPCRVKEINADSNLIQNVGDLPLSLQSLSFIDNPILNRDLLKEGWFKNDEGNWLKQTKKYDCGFAYAVKSHCDSCTVGYQLTDKVKELERLDLTYFAELLSSYALEDSLDLSNFSKLKVFIAAEITVKVITFPQSIQFVKMYNGAVEKTLGFNNNLRYLDVSTLKSIAQPLSDSLKYLAVANNRTYYSQSDTLKYMPPTLKYLDLKNNTHIAPSIKWAQSLEKLSYTGVLPQQVLPNLKRLVFTNETTQFEPIFKQYTGLKYLKYLKLNDAKFSILNNLPLNLDTLIVFAEDLDTITSMSFGDSLRYLQLNTNLPEITEIKAANLTHLDLSGNGINKITRLNTPNLIVLDLSNNKLETLPSVLPKKLQLVDLFYNPISANTLLKLDCEWWQQLDKDAVIHVVFKDEKIAKKLRKKTKKNPCINQKLRVYFSLDTGKGHSTIEIK